MALKDIWIKQDNSMDANPEIPNMLADAIIELEKKQGQGGGTSVEVDKTLSIEGAAADAKAVGDALGDVETALDHIIELQEQYKSYAVSTMSEGGDGV